MSFWRLWGLMFRRLEGWYSQPCTEKIWKKLASIFVRTRITFQRDPCDMFLCRGIQFIHWFRKTKNCYFLILAIFLPISDFVNSADIDLLMSKNRLGFELGFMLIVLHLNPSCFIWLFSNKSCIFCWHHHTWDETRRGS